MSDDTGTEDWGSKVKRILTAVWNYGSDPPVPKPAAGTEIGDVMEDGKIYAGVGPGEGHMYVKWPKKSGPDALPEGTLYLGKGKYFADGEFLTSDDSPHKNDKGNPPKPDGGGLTFEQLKAAADAEPGRSTRERDFENLKRALENLPDHSKNPPKSGGPS